MTSKELAQITCLQILATKSTQLQVHLVVVEAEIVDHLVVVDHLLPAVAVEEDFYRVQVS